jgi:hypothetical protein
VSARLGLCRQCRGIFARADLRGATVAQAAQSYRIIEGDLLCRVCAEDLSLDATLTPRRTVLAHTMGLRGAA